MRLYYDPISTTSRPVVMFAIEHQLALDCQVVSLAAAEHLSDWYRAINPNCVVPVLEDGDFRLSQSSAILKYLADKVASPCYPSEPRARARINAAMDWIMADLHPQIGYNYAYLCFPHHRAGKSETTLSEIRGAAIPLIQRRLTVMNDHMIGPDNDYLCGPQLTLADYLGASVMSCSEYDGFDLTPWPNVTRWVKTMQARPSWGETYEAFNGMIRAMRAPAALSA